MKAAAGAGGAGVAEVGSHCRQTPAHRMVPRLCVGAGNRERHWSPLLHCQTQVTVGAIRNI